MNEITYYQDREEPDALFMFNWDTNTGYIWNYKIKKWKEYEPVAEYIGKQDNLRCLKKEAVEAEIKKYS